MSSILGCLRPSVKLEEVNQLDTSEPQHHGSRSKASSPISQYAAGQDLLNFANINFWSKPSSSNSPKSKSPSPAKGKAAESLANSKVARVLFSDISTKATSSASGSASAAASSSSSSGAAVAPAAQPSSRAGADGPTSGSQQQPGKPLPFIASAARAGLLEQAGGPSVGSLAASFSPTLSIDDILSELAPEPGVTCAAPAPLPILGRTGSFSINASRSASIAAGSAAGPGPLGLPVEQPRLLPHAIAAVPSLSRITVRVPGDDASSGCSTPAAQIPAAGTNTGSSTPALSYGTMGMYGSTTMSSADASPFANQLSSVGGATQPFSQHSHMLSHSLSLSHLQVSQPGSLQASPRTASQQPSPRSPRLAHHASYIRRGPSSSRLSHKSDIALSGLLDPLTDDDTMRDLNSANPLSSLPSTEVPGSPAKARLLGIRFVTPINSPHASCRSPRISTSGEAGVISALNSPRGSSRPCSPLASMTFAGPSPYGRLLSSHSSLRPPAPWADSPVDSPTGESSSPHAAHPLQYSRGLEEQCSSQRPACDPSRQADDDGHGHCSPLPDSGSPTYGRRVSTSRLAAGCSRLSQSSVGRCSSSTLGTPLRLSRSSGGGNFEVPDHSHGEGCAVPGAAASSFRNAAAALGLPPLRQGLTAVSSRRTSLSQAADAEGEQQSAHVVETCAGSVTMERQCSVPDPTLVSLAAALTQAGVGGQVTSLQLHQHQMQQQQQQQVQQQMTLLQQLQEEEDAAASSELYPDIPEVTFIDMLGRGSYGNVYKGVWHDHIVAIKVVSSQPVAPGSPEAADPMRCRQLARSEYESWLNWQLHHPHVVLLYTAFSVRQQQAGLPGLEPAVELWRTHLIMEYCDLGTLQDACRKGAFRDQAGELDWWAVLATARDITSAIRYLHANVVVHGDLKGSNVLLRTPTEEHNVAEEDSRGFVAVVSDFGLSRLEEQEGAAAPGEYSPRRRSMEMGAISHAAPEVVAGAALSKAADIFALGVLLWELVASCLPFAGLNAAQVMSVKLMGATADMLAFPDNVDQGYAELCTACWAEPEQRPSAQQLDEALDQLALKLLGRRMAAAQDAQAPGPSPPAA